MTQHDVLELFRVQASSLGEVEASQSEIILRLAQLIADTKAYLPEKDFEVLVHIGAVMYQEGLGQYRARQEVATTMERSSQSQQTG